MGSFLPDLKTNLTGARNSFSVEISQFEDPKI